MWSKNGIALLNGSGEYEKVIVQCQKCEGSLEVSALGDTEICPLCGEETTHAVDDPRSLCEGQELQPLPPKPLPGMEPSTGEMNYEEQEFHSNEETWHGWSYTGFILFSWLIDFILLATSNPEIPLFAFSLVALVFCATVDNLERKTLKDPSILPVNTWILILPIYLYRRAKYLQRGMKTFWIYMAAGFLPIIPFVALDSFISASGPAGDFVSYSEQIAALAEIESRAVEPMGSLEGKTDDEIHIVLRDTVIPNYETFFTRLQEVAVDSEEIRTLHSVYLDGVQEQLSGYRGMERALLNQDENAFNTALETTLTGGQKIGSYVAQFNGLKVKHGLQ